MLTRRLGNTDLHLPVLSFGASSLGAEFRSVTLDEVGTGSGARGQRRGIRGVHQ